MTDFSHSRENDIDIITIDHDFNETTVSQLGKTISDLRQQGSTKILLLGGRLHYVRNCDLETLALPIRHFRRFGGIIAMAELGDPVARQFRSTRWYKHLNIFQTKEEAMQFLTPSSKM